MRFKWALKKQWQKFYLKHNYDIIILIVIIIIIPTNFCFFPLVKSKKQKKNFSAIPSEKHVPSKVFFIKNKSERNIRHWNQVKCLRTLYTVHVKKFFLKRFFKQVISIVQLQFWCFTLEALFQLLAATLIWWNKT